MQRGNKKYKYNLCNEGDFFLIVTYEAFVDESDGGAIIQIRTVDFMGEASLCPDHLPKDLTKSIQQAIESKVAQTELV